MLSNLLKQGMHYASGTLLLSVASLISFPILTRFLPVDQYGMLSLLTTLAGIIVAVYKFGLQQSIIRYFKKSDDVFNTSVLYAMSISLLAVSVMLVLFYLCFNTDISYQYFYSLLLISVFQACRSVVISNYAASEKSIYVNGINVIYKYLSLFAMLLFIFYYERSAISVLFSMLAIDGLIAAAIMFNWFKTFKLTKPDTETIKTLFIYGSPLMLAELVQMAHAFADRFMIEHYLGLEQVAMYVAPYSMSKIISDIVFGGLATALVPIYMGMWNRQEHNNVSLLLKKASDYYVLLFPVTIGGLYLIAESLIGLAASEKYTQTAFIMPIAFIGVGLFSSTFIYSAGLRIRKNQTAILRYATESLLLNVTLNYIFMPMFGIVASAWATVASYAWMSLRFYRASQATVNVPINLNNLVTGSLIAGVLIILSDVLPSHQHYAVELSIRLVLGGSIAVSMLLVLNKGLRTDLSQAVSFIKQKFCKSN
ncbi:MAG: polysaccharide biosynthesis protein [Oceanospirillaceae bacterium]|nr:polysaccharide biosynthesis protein [Oceanospirillaceae bacterium]MCP5335215.1 polysaccharide biosynthesis protein [Oceanospirillaceae bacterium]